MWEELCALTEDTIVDAVLPLRDRSFGESVLLRGRSSRSGGVGALILFISSASTCLMAGEEEEDSDDVVALLPRDCGRDDSREEEEGLVFSDGVRSPGVVSALGKAAGSMITGFALLFSSAIAILFEGRTKRHKHRSCATGIPDYMLLTIPQPCAKTPSSPPCCLSS